MKRFSITGDAMREIDAVSAMLRTAGDRTAFVRDVIRWLELRNLSEPSNNDVERAIADVIGVVKL
jgi:hypothetical protein